MDLKNFFSGTFPASVTWDVNLFPEPMTFEFSEVDKELIVTMAGRGPYTTVASDAVNRFLHTETGKRELEKIRIQAKRQARQELIDLTEMLFPESEGFTVADPSGANELEAYVSPEVLEADPEAFWDDNNSFWLD